MKLENCCICIPLEVGVYLIGGTIILSLACDFVYFYLLRTVIEGTTIIIFIIMLVSNIASTRLLFFSAYLVNLICKIFIIVFGPDPEHSFCFIESKVHAINVCDRMDEKDKIQFEKRHGECVIKMENYIFYGTIVSLTLYLLI